MSKLIELREAFAQKAQEMHKVFEEAGEDRAFDKVTSLGDIKGSVAVAEWVQQRNAELGRIHQEIEGLDDYQKMVKDNQDRMRLASQPAGDIVHPTGGAPGNDGQQSLVLHKSFAQKVVESDVIKEYQRSRRQSPTVELDVPDLVAVKATLTETGYAPQAVRTGLILPGALRRPVVADLLPQGTTDQIAIVYMEETTTTNGAAAVAEGVAKPESALVFTEKTSPVRKIATVLPVTDELIADVPAMRSYIEARLRLFLDLAEDSTILVGDGIAPNLLGLLNVVGINTQAKGADPTPDTIYKAMVKIMTTSFLNASGVVFHPLDWQDVKLLRTADGIYIWGSPDSMGPDRIWGLPVVSTVAITQNTALVGAFDSATQIFRRVGVTFAISDQHQDFFVLNKLMLRVEERLAVVCYRPQGLCTCTGV